MQPSVLLPVASLDSSFVSTRHDGRGRWLWRLVGPFLHLSLQGIQCPQDHRTILRIGNPLRNSRGRTLVLPAAGILLPRAVLRGNVGPQKIKMLTIRDPELMTAAAFGFGFG